MEPPKRKQASAQQDTIWSGPNVVLMPREELSRLSEPCQACGKLNKYALLPNWRQIAAAAPALPVKSTVVDGDDRADGTVTVDTTKDPRQDSMLEDSPSPAELDLEQLVSILQDNLPADAQNGDVASEIQQILAKTLSSGEELDLEQILEQLTKSVLARVEENGTDSHMGQWLAQNGVQIPEDSDDDVEASREHKAASGQPAEQSSEASHRAKTSQQHVDKEAMDASKPVKQRGLDLKSKGDLPRLDTIQVEASATKDEAPSASAKGRKRKVEDDSDDRSLKKRAPTSTTDEEIPQLPAKRVTRSSRQKK